VRRRLHVTKATVALTNDEAFDLCNQFISCTYLVSVICGTLVAYFRASHAHACLAMFLLLATCPCFGSRMDLVVYSGSLVLQLLQLARAKFHYSIMHATRVESLK
jgi:hypothetical protein